MRGSVVVVDTREGVMNESGDVLLSGAAIHAELGEILAGTRSVPPGATTVFESVGMAVEDVAAANWSTSGYGLAEPNVERRVAAHAICDGRMGTLLAVRELW